MNHEDHKDHKEPLALSSEVEAIGRQVVDSAIKVHRLLGPGLLESAYEHCLAHELHGRGLAVRRQVALPIQYEGLKLEAGYRLDVLVADNVIVEVKAVEALSRLHEAQVLTYLRLSGLRVGISAELQLDAAPARPPAICPLASWSSWSSCSKRALAAAGPNPGTGRA